MGKAVARLAGFGTGLLLSPAILMAQALEPDSIDQAIRMIPTLMEAFQQGKFLAAGAGVTLISVFGFRKFILPKIPLGTGVLPLVSALLGVASGVAVSVMGGAAPTQAALAILSGPVASTLWDSLFKFFFNKPEQK